MHIILPLVLIVIILILITLLCIRPPVISLRADHTTRRQVGRSPRPEEEERLLSGAEEQDALPRHNDQLHSTKDYTFDHTTSENDWWKLSNAKKAEEIEIACENIAKLQRDLSTSASQNAELQCQIVVLSRDLEGARLFLTTADTFSDSEVIQMLQKLNAELQHTSTVIADRLGSVLKFDRDVTTLDPEQQVVANRASESTGSTLVQSFRTARRDSFPMYLQIAFQAYLTHHLCWIVSSWTLDHGRNTFINEIYQRLRETERQAISARWRSLTRAYALPTCVSEPNSFVTPIIAGLSDILLAAGCAASQSDIVSELSLFETKILSAVSLAGRLNQMIGGIISGDLEVFVVRPGKTFHEGMMEEDMDGGGDEVQGTPGGTGRVQTVLCTSELGLMKRVQLEMEEKVTVTKTVIKAKVILESFLDADD